TPSRTRTRPRTCSGRGRRDSGSASEAERPALGPTPPIPPTRLRPVDVVDPRALDSVLRRHGVRAAKSIGQHFLVDRAALAAIVEAAEITGHDDVLEIGPGPGGLTAALADRARSVTSVEIDERMVAV